MKTLNQAEATESMGAGERLRDLRRKTAEFLGDIIEDVLMWPAEKVLDWAEDKPTYVKALGAYVVAPALLATEAVGGTLLVMGTAATLGPIAAAGVAGVELYAWFQTMAVVGGLHRDIWG